MRALWRLIRLFLVTLVYTAGVAAVAAAKPANTRDAFRARHQGRGSRMLCRIFGIRIRVRGERPERAVQLVVCNHFGILDPFILASVLNVAFAAKAEIRGWPFVGWMSRVYGVIFVDRERKQAAADFIRRVRDRMESGVPVFVFPEGTTSADEEVLPFKTGSFAAVAETSAVILPVYLRPVAINGQRAVGPVRSAVTWAGGNEPLVQNLRRILSLRSMDMEVCLGTAFSADNRNRKELAEAARARVIALRDQERRMDTFVG